MPNTYFFLNCDHQFCCSKVKSVKSFNAKVWFHRRSNFYTENNRRVFLKVDKKILAKLMLWSKKLIFMHTPIRSIFSLNWTILRFFLFFTDASTCLYDDLHYLTKCEHYSLQLLTRYETENINLGWQILKLLFKWGKCFI